MNPHFGHLYGRPNFLHFWSRFIWISPQFGHINFVACAAGGIGFPQLVHEMRVNVEDVFSVIVSILVVHSVIVRLTYILYVYDLRSEMAMKDRRNLPSGRSSRSTYFSIADEDQEVNPNW
jgi:hypothetical protein